jgi:EPS-associated MarR family transcriptional regulator
MKNINQQEFNLLRKISKKPNVNQRELAFELEVSLGKINYILVELKKKGLIKINNFKNNSNKSNYLYLLTPKGISQKAIITKEFIKRKLQEYEELKRELNNDQQI